jgi:cysteine desulfurase / selenocysteine lyase
VNVPSEIRGRLRAQMPVSQEFSYLDHAAVAPIPQTAADDICQYALQATREGDTRWLDWSAKAQQTRQLAAELVGAKLTEIALVANTTQGITIVAEGVRWRDGDNLVVPENEFPSNLLPWKMLARRGVEVRLAKVSPRGEITAQTLAPYIDQRTKLVTLSWIGFSSGYRAQLDSISELVHNYDCKLFVDAIQGLGAFPLDVASLGIDFLAADGHKWMLGPEGAGLLYVNSNCLDDLDPVGVGWNSLASGGFDPKSSELKKSAARFEGGSSNMAGVIGLRASLKLLLELGCNQPHGEFQATILQNVGQLQELLLCNDFDVYLPETEANRSGILGVRWPEADAEGESAYLRARKHLLSRKVVVSVRAGKLRVATHAYNNLDDHQRLTAALIEFRAGQQ